VRNEELFNYIRSELLRGVSQEDLRQGLKEAGWKREDVEDCISGILKEKAKTESVSSKVHRDKPKRSAAGVKSFRIYKGVGFKIQGKPTWQAIIIVALVFSLSASTTFGAYKVYKNVTQDRPLLSLIPADSESFVHINVYKNHAQTKTANKLLDRLPGINKLNSLVQPYFIAIREPLDAFEPIFSLANKDIFLANVSGDAENEDLQYLFGGFINIIEVERPQDIQRAVTELESSPDVSLQMFLYEGHEIKHVRLSRYKKSQPSNDPLSLLLGQALTLPFSKGFYFTAIDNFIVSSESQSDIEKIISLVDNQSRFFVKNLSSGSILGEDNYRNLKNRAPGDHVLQFYGKKNSALFIHKGKLKASTE